MVSLECLVPKNPGAIATESGWFGALADVASGSVARIQMSLSGELSKKPQIAVKSLDLVTNELFDYT